ncbi:ABC-type dipeptide/oligopeptide/nickel transport system, permease component [Candidatus Vecturithrix granuli]|uniref:ABC-type dipeptide/oligopeptide/nickel transport system, permease component n=1 Tax=Vecturithrix granuli TaxID=1499967 RepID=A0A081C7H8_VECG1|nr:ABC-type dipeptide/oligopeptide/nickel transport system, permease component [Candidatus Vecturithrix granuli]
MKFYQYILRRLGLMVFSLLGVLIVTFFVSHVIPADPIGAILGPQAPLELIEKIRHELGFDRPVHVQFFIYLKNSLRGDFGKSLRTQNPVIKDLRTFFPATVELATVAMFIGVFLGIPLGILSAVKKDQWGDHIARGFSLIGLSMPVFWLALILLLIFYYRLGWLPGPGRIDPYLFPQAPITGIILLDSLIYRDFEIFFNALQHIILPAFVLGYFSTASIVRITRSSMLEVLNLDYVQTARAKGLRESVVIYKHALKNAMIPVTTVIGLTYGSLLEGAVLTETIFAWPGLGRYMTSAFLFLDFNAVMGGTLLIALIFSLANLVVDILYAFLNPKIRFG